MDELVELVGGLLIFALAVTPLAAAVWIAFKVLTIG